MSEDGDRYEMVCKGEFGSIHKKLDALDVAIRGNGKPGIQLRLDRLENAHRTMSRILWIVLGSTVTLAAEVVWRKISGG